MSLLEHATGIIMLDIQEISPLIPVTAFFMQVGSMEMGSFEIYLQIQISTVLGLVI